MAPPQRPQWSSRASEPSNPSQPALYRGREDRRGFTDSPRPRTALGAGPTSKGAGSGGKGLRGSLVVGGTGEGRGLAKGAGPGTETDGV